MIRGIGTAAIPAAIPLALANPLTALSSAAVGIPAQFGAESGARALGASPEASALAGDVAGGLAGGLAGGATSKVQGIASRANRAQQDALMDAVPVFGRKAINIRNAFDPPQRVVPAPPVTFPQQASPSAPRPIAAPPVTYPAAPPAQAAPRPIAAPPVTYPGGLGTQAVGEGGTRFIQHLGDMRINGRTPPAPKVYDAFGREVNR